MNAGAPHQWSLTGAARRVAATPWLVVGLLACLLTCRVLTLIVLNYRDYFPPNFRADFLLGREAYFFGGYHWAFYAHIVSGPLCLLTGLALMMEREPFSCLFVAIHPRGR